MNLITFARKTGMVAGLPIAALSFAGVFMIILSPPPRPRSLVLLLLVLLAIAGVGWAAFWAAVGLKRQWSQRRCYNVAAFSFMLICLLLSAPIGFSLSGKGGFWLGATCPSWGVIVGALSRKIAYPELKFGGPPPEPPVTLHIT